MSPSLSRTQALVLGIVILAALVLGGYGLFVLGSGQWPWNQPLHVKVGFPSAQGVTPGTHVRVQGVDAGEVEDVVGPERPGDKVVLRLRLDHRFRGVVREDAKAQLVAEGIFGGKIVEVRPGSPEREPVADGAEIAAIPSNDIADVVAQIGNLAESIDQQKGKVAEVVDNTNQLVRKTTETVESVQQVVEGVKDVAYLRDKIKDPQKALAPPGCECKPWWFTEGELFDPNSDRLTAKGRGRLDELIKTIADLTRHPGSEVVVVAYADPHSADMSRVRRLTQNQSEVVGDYLVARGAIHKDYGVVPRKVTKLGLGTDKPPLEGR